MPSRRPPPPAPSPAPSPSPPRASTSTSASTRPFPPYDGDRYDVSQSVGHQLFNLKTMMRREVEARMAALDLTDAQWRPLWMLASGRADTANEMARLLEMDAGAMTRLLDRLEAKGLVARSRSATDRRVVHLQLTDAGRAAVAEVPHVLAAVNNAFLQGFSEAEWLQLRALIGRMAANGAALPGGRDSPWRGRAGPGSPQPRRGPRRWPRCRLRCGP